LRPAWRHLRIKSILNSKIHRRYEQADGVLGGLVDRG